MGPGASAASPARHPTSLRAAGRQQSPYSARLRRERGDGQASSSPCVEGAYALPHPLHDRILRRVQQHQLHRPRHRDAAQRPAQRVVRRLPDSGSSGRARSPTKSAGGRPRCWRARAARSARTAARRTRRRRRPRKSTGSSCQSGSNSRTRAPAGHTPGGLLAGRVRAQLGHRLRRQRHPDGALRVHRDAHLRRQAAGELAGGRHGEGHWVPTTCRNCCLGAEDRHVRRAVQLDGRQVQVGGWRARRPPAAAPTRCCGRAPPAAGRPRWALRGRPRGFPPARCRASLRRGPARTAAGWSWRQP